MKKLYTAALFVLFLAIGAGTAFAATPQEIKQGNRTYYVVTSTDPAQDTGNEVCALVKKQCAGYTGFTTKICEIAHPNAAKKSDANGSKAGFYCNGSPQGGVCANETNTCHICPSCNVNADCSTQIGDLYREMYVECTGGEPVSPEVTTEAIESGKLTGMLKNIWGVPGRWWGSFRSAVARSFDLYREKLERMTIKQVKKARIQVTGPSGTVEADIPADSYVCEFYQQNKKLATCGALAAADQFCVTAFGSRFATAALCQDNGVIICSKPCVTNPQEVAPQRCAFDADRPRGNQAAPLNFCNTTITVDTKALATKKAGEVCAHGGECTTGFCLGQTSDQGIKYFCSCKQNVLDFTCGK